MADVMLQASWALSHFLFKLQNEGHGCCKNVKHIKKKHGINEAILNSDNEGFTI